MTIRLGCGAARSCRAEDSAWFVTAVFFGSMLWSTLPSSAAWWLRSLINIRPILLSRLSALTLACFGTRAILVKGLKQPCTQAAGP